MLKDKICFIGVGQAGGNIVDLFTDLGYDSIVVNTQNSDSSYLNVTNKYIIEEVSGFGHNREKAKEYAYKHKEIILKQINSSIQDKEIVIVVFSAGGGTGSGIGTVISDLLSNKDNKEVCIVSAMPSYKEALNIQVNAYKCLVDISNLKKINSVFLIDNNKGDIISLNKKFADLFDTFIKMSEISSIKGNVDDAEIKELLLTRGCSVLYKADNADKLLEEYHENNIFVDIENDRKIVYMGLSTNSLIDYTYFYDKVGIPLDTFININDKFSFLILSGLSFPKLRAEKILSLINDRRKDVEEAINNSISDSIQDRLEWNVRANKGVLLEDIFRKY